MWDPFGVQSTGHDRILPGQEKRNAAGIRDRRVDVETGAAFDVTSVGNWSRRGARGDTLRQLRPFRLNILSSGISQTAVTFSSALHPEAPVTLEFHRAADDKGTVAV